MKITFLMVKKTNSMREKKTKKKGKGSNNGQIYIIWMRFDLIQ